MTGPKHHSEPETKSEKVATGPNATDMPPRWAFERMEEERARHLGVKPNPANVDVFMGSYDGWSAYHAFAAYIARTEQPPHS